MIESDPFYAKFCTTCVGEHRPRTIIIIPPMFTGRPGLVGLAGSRLLWRGLRRRGSTRLQIACAITRKPIKGSAVSHFSSRLPGAAMSMQKAARFPLLPVAALTLLAVVSAQRE